MMNIWNIYYYEAEYCTLTIIFPINCSGLVPKL